MRISDWSSDVCSSDLGRRGHGSALLAGEQLLDVALAIVVGRVLELAGDVVGLGGTERPREPGLPVVTGRPFDNANDVVNGVLVLGHVLRSPINVPRGRARPSPGRSVGEPRGPLAPARGWVRCRREIGRASCRERVCQYV